MTAASQDEATRVKLTAWLVTDVGVVRDHNEDSAHKDPERGFFIVADGMGGHAAGEVASAMAVETVQKTLEAAYKEINEFTRNPTDAGRRNLVQLLQSAVLQAHQAVFQRGQAEQDKAGMGTTLDVVVVAGPEAFVAHVGDSRTYLIRDGRTSQITTDHTVAEVLVIEGKLTIEEAQVSPLRTILVNAIGVSADVGVEMAHVTLKRNDRLLLCSDGLHDYFPMEEEIAQRLSAEAPGDAIAEMVELAKTRGGHDNITGIVVHILEVAEASTAGLEGESTQPVDVPNNPFAQDEPTETALVPPPPSGTTTGAKRLGAVEISPSSLRQTQPMRALEDDANADTIPPKTKIPSKDGAATTLTATAKKDPTTEPVLKVDPDEITAPPPAKTEPMYVTKKPEPAPESDAAAAKADADKPKAKPKKKKAKSDASDSSDDKSDAGDGDDSDDKAESEKSDGAPTEIATADTGRVAADKKSDS